MKKNFTLSLFLTSLTVVWAQPDISYYLPEAITYNPAIPTPQSVLDA